MALTAKQRKDVSKRMKAYWAKRREERRRHNVFGAAIDTIDELRDEQVENMSGITSFMVGVKPYDDPVEHPKHYTSHPSGVECIQITEHMGFNLGNALKYIWRADLKHDAVEDMQKAVWYLNREIEKRARSANP